jgi:hypothetical protein
MRIIPFRRRHEAEEHGPLPPPPSAVGEDVRVIGADPGARTDADPGVSATEAPPDAELAEPAESEPAEAEPADESGIPRWRRASLIAARHADRNQPAAIVHLTFGDGATAAIEGIVTTRIRYRLVELLAEPDETRAAIVGGLDEGDEVQIIETRGLYRRVRCPDGREGWVHRMTLEVPTSLA